MTDQAGSDAGDAKHFASVAQLEDWLAQHHATETELWVRIYKKKAGVRSVSWDDCVVAALIWGWIDGQKRALDDLSYLQRLSPRRARSSWSKRNITLVETLVAQDRMAAPGMAHVQAAKANGQWENAYAGSADMEMPADLIEAIQDNPAAMAALDALPRSRQFEIYIALKSARRPETRARRFAAILATLTGQ